MSYQREFDRRLRLGVIGVGSHSYRNILPCLHYLPVELVALCDRDPEALAGAAAEYGVTATYADSAAMYAGERLDAVILCVGPRQHPELACEALAAGVHVWMEKPAAMALAGIEAVRTARGSDQIVMVGFKKAFMPAITKTRELLAEQASGPLRTVLAEYPMDLPEDGAGVLERGDNHNWFNNGCHPLSAMLAIGGPVQSVTAHRGAHGGGVVLLEYVSGALGSFHLAAGMAGPRERYVAYADGAHVEIENGGRVTWHRGTPMRYGRSTSFAPAGVDHGSVVWEPQNHLGTLENKSLFVQGFYQELMAFCAACLDGGPSDLGGLDFTYELTRVSEAALRSAGRRIAWEPIDWAAPAAQPA